MRLRARLLHVLVLAPAAAIAAAVPGPTAHAQDAAATTQPQPIVIALDPGHGGASDNSNPSQPFDPGAISANGLMEKVVTLDVAQRVATLLQNDLVATVLTRTTDKWVTVSEREQIGIDAHADRFVSIHCNSFTDASASGSLVLYPGPDSLAFAQTVADALGKGLVSSAVTDQGVVLRNDWWIHNPMPTATVEMAYLSNPREAALLATSDFRQQVALAIRDGIERGDPNIATRKAAIQAWLQSHPGATAPALARPATHPVAHAAQSNNSSPAGALITLLVLAMLAAAGYHWRGELVRFTGVHRAAARRRRRRLRLHTLTAVTEQRWLQRSVYDDLPF
ncbi:MAG: N-acetylmuramoyl-L-alanine amidase family protein [Candidatus Dormibacteria bacterium]